MRVFCCAANRAAKEQPVSQRQQTYLEALAERVLIYDGAMGTSIDTYNLTAETIERITIDRFANQSTS